MQSEKSLNPASDTVFPSKAVVLDPDELVAGRDGADVTVTTTTIYAAPVGAEVDSSVAHEKSMTEKMKNLVVDNARLAKEKTFDVIHTAYEKIHDAGIAVEERAAQVLKHLGHAQVNKAEELEQCATEKRVEDESQPKTPGVLDKASTKLQEAGIAIEEKAGKLLKGAGQTQHETAKGLEQYATEKRVDDARPKSPGILDKAGMKLQEATAAVEEKAGKLLEGAGQTGTTKAADFEQDATKKRVIDVQVPFWEAQAHKKRTPSPRLHALDESAAGGSGGVAGSQEAFDAFKKVSANVEDKAARAFRGIGESSYAKPGELGSDVELRQYRTTSPPVLGGTVSSTSSEPLPQQVPPRQERKLVPDPVD